MSAVRVWVCGERYVIGKSCKKVSRTKKKFQKSEKKGKCCKKVHKKEKKTGKR